MNAAISNVQECLVGVWTLVEWSEQQSGGHKAFPLGEDAVGQIIYTADGHVAAQLVRRGRRSFSSGDWREARDEDAARAFKEYFGYFGTFSIDTEKQVVTHHIEGSWFPNLEGSDQERRFRLEDGLLVLDADTDWGKVMIVWRKAEPRR
ncbi:MULTISPECIES: lipocalin-like domain-containing protein [unclassified Sinorhizobium]|uniref:lipocalin-like domain-containing protein n=1 Tax=unclassified Sinorhizobium TaxID=2613772 RepID=UPI003524046C